MMSDNSVDEVVIVIIVVVVAVAVGVAVGVGVGERGRRVSIRKVGGEG